MQNSGFPGTDASELAPRRPRYRRDPGEHTLIITALREPTAALLPAVREFADCQQRSANGLSVTKKTENQPGKCVSGEGRAGKACLLSSCELNTKPAL